MQEKKTRSSTIHLYEGSWSRCRAPNCHLSNRLKVTQCCFHIPHHLSWSSQLCKMARPIISILQRENLRVREIRDLSKVIPKGNGESSHGTTSGSKLQGSSGASQCLSARGRMDTALSVRQTARVSCWMLFLRQLDFSTEVDFQWYWRGFFCPNLYHRLTLGQHGNPFPNASSGSRKPGELTTFLALHLTHSFALIFYKCLMMVAKTSHQPFGQGAKWLIGKQCFQNLDIPLHYSDGRLPKHAKS